MTPLTPYQIDTMRTIRDAGPVASVRDLHGSRWPGLIRRGHAEYVGRIGIRLTERGAKALANVERVERIRAATTAREKFAILKAQ